MMSSVPLRRELCLKHQDDLLRIVNSTPWLRWNSENLLYELPRKWELSILVLDGDTPAAFSINSWKLDSCYVHAFMTAPESAGTGMGQTLLQMLTTRLLSMGIDTIRLCVHRENSRAVSFYLKNGFIHEAYADADDLLLCKKVR